MELKEYNSLKRSMRRLYHASMQQFRAGHTISVNDFEGDTAYFYRLLEDTKKLVEEELEIHRPAENVSRKKCIFFFKDPVICQYFAQSQYPKKDIYEVAVCDVCGGFPMHIVGRLETLIKNELDCSAQIKEYWHPSKQWNCLEYLGNSMTIIPKKYMVMR